MDEVIEEISRAVEEVQFENEDQRDDIQYTLSESVKAVTDWKMHILRSVNQDGARSDVIEGLTESEVLLERDWAMTFLPMMYRESLSKWFGKSVGTYKTDEDIHSHTIIHVFDNASQDTTTSNAILKDCVDRLKAKYPKLLKAYVRSDNAGCFHRVEGIFGIPCLNEQSDLKIVQVDFADPQSGKSICDRRAAHIKGSVRKYVNEGNNVTTSFEFLNAVTKTNIKNVEIVSACSGGMFQKTLPKIKDITSLNNFQFHQDYVLAFKQYQIGNGIRLPNTSVKVYNSFPTIDVVTSGRTDESVNSTKPVKGSSGHEAVTSTCTLHDEEICAKVNENNPQVLQVGVMK